MQAQETMAAASPTSMQLAEDNAERKAQATSNGIESDAPQHPSSLVRTALACVKLNCRIGLELPDGR